MAPRFKGELAQLQEAISAAGVEGTWKEEEGGKTCFRSRDGGVLNWWPGTGTMQVQGQAEAKAALEAALPGVPAARAATPSYQSRTRHQP